VKVNGKGDATAKRDATTDMMLDAAGRPVRDEGVEMSVTALRHRVAQSIGGASK